MKRSGMRGKSNHNGTPDCASLHPGYICAWSGIDVISLRAAPTSSPSRLQIAVPPFSVDAIVILPDHLHTIMTLPAEDADFSGRWRRIKSLFTHDLVRGGLAIARNRRGEYSLWQRRFWEHTVRDEGDFAGHVDYIHYNPVKHGLVSRVSDWVYSSFHRYVRQGVLPQDWVGVAGGEGADFGEP
jgi:REP-associated tyrosine transposase